MAVAEAERTTKSGSKSGSNGHKRPTNRDQAAKLILTALTDEPKSEAQVRRDLGFAGRTSSGRADVFKSGFGVLEARHQARFIPASEGKRSGWVRYDATVEAPELPGEAIEFPYEWKVLPVNAMFIDPAYQRPLTSFVEKIRRNFNPVLFQVLVVNLREQPNKDGKTLAVVDGQTRWVAAERRGIKEVPCIQFIHLTPEQEAEMFALLQKERKGVLSLHRFKAQVAAKNPESLAIVRIAKSAGWKIGEGSGQLRAPGALEWAYKRSPELLERTLTLLNATWPQDKVPEDVHIRGLHYFLQNFPLGERVTKLVDDDRLVTKLQAAGLSGIERKLVDAKAYHGKGTKATLMAYAIQSIYGKK